MGTGIKTYKLLKHILQAVVGWIIAVPASFLAPKQDNLILFIGRDDGQFTDNVKHLFLYMNNPENSDAEIFFLTQNKDTYELLRKNSLPVLFYPGMQAVLKMLRAGTVIVDNWNWVLDMKYHLLYKSGKVQLWHGLPLKKIELDNKKEIEKRLPFFMKLRNRIGGRFPHYDLLVSTSGYFTENTFSTAFRSKRVAETGYPRNDCLFNGLNESFFIGTDVKSKESIEEMKAKGFKIVAYAPTFRESGDDYTLEGILDFRRLSGFAEKHGIQFVMKFHPNPDFPHEIFSSDNIIFYEPSADIYPVLPFVDILITDYSSIYFDYLLLDKPAIFFPYDYDNYLTEERDMYFDYEEMTPGPKCYTQEELENAISGSLAEEGRDKYKEVRKQIVELAFKYKDGKSSERIRQFVSDLDN